MVRVTAEGLRMHADDHGRGFVEFRQILADVWPETSEVTESVLVDHLLILAEADVIALYEHDGRSCYAFTMWGRVDRASDSGIPDPPPFARASRAARESVASPSREPREPLAAGESGSERASEGEGGSASGGETHAPRMSREELPPDPFCPDHPGGVLEPCIACQNARLRNKRFLDIRRWEMRQTDEPF